MEKNPNDSHIGASKSPLHLDSFTQDGGGNFESFVGLEPATPKLGDLGDYDATGHIHLY